ncbi:MAG: TonB family protein [Alphaproteobacteria bacterium]|nr:TonB family protein [Alphaproteobacteria bacterium]
MQLRTRRSDAQEKIHDGYLLLAMLAALAIHSAAYGIWRSLPRDEVVDIPVRVLSLKLAETEDTLADDGGASRTSANAAGVEQAIEKIARDIQGTTRADDRSEVVEKSAQKNKKEAPVNMEKLMAKAKPFDMRTEGVAVAAPVQSVVAKQYVREAEPAQLEASDGTDMITRYEQLISSWIDKFKPEKLMVSGQPERAVASVRIRIDRRGNIRFLELDKRSGLEELDRAALDTVRRANPVPAAPQDYPSGEMIEFIVPIVFTR